jgi:hypothetical protein
MPRVLKRKTDTDLPRAAKVAKRDLYQEDYPISPKSDGGRQHVLLDSIPANPVNSCDTSSWAPPSPGKVVKFTHLLMFSCPFLVSTIILSIPIVSILGTQGDQNVCFEGRVGSEYTELILFSLLVDTHRLIHRGLRFLS